MRVVSLAICTRWAPFSVPTFLPGMHQLGACGFLVVLRMTRRDAVFDETHFPFQIFFKRRTLEKLALFPLEALATILRTQRQQIAATRFCGRPAGLQRWIFVRSAVAIGAINLHRCRNLAVDMPVTMRILRKMAVDAMHAHIEMNRCQVDGLLKFFRIGIVDRFVFFVEQRALAVSFEYVTEIPAMAMVVGKLGVFQRWIEF